MAIKIFTVNTLTSGYGREYNAPFDVYFNDMANYVDWIEVTGDEIETIAEQFNGNQGLTNGIAFPTNYYVRKVVRWYGDQAKFIVGNIQDNER
jgi:hypothetical protein